MLDRNFLKNIPDVVATFLQTSDLVIFLLLLILMCNLFESYQELLDLLQITFISLKLHNKWVCSPIVRKLIFQIFTEFVLFYYVCDNCEKNVFTQSGWEFYPVPFGICVTQTFFLYAHCGLHEHWKGAFELLQNLKTDLGEISFSTKLKGCAEKLYVIRFGNLFFYTSRIFIILFPMSVVTVKFLY